MRVEVLPVRNYSHLELEPTSSTSDATIGQNNESTVPLEVTASSPRVEEKQPMENRTIMPEVITTESGMEVEVTTEQTVTDSAIIDEENQTTIAEDEEDEFGAPSSDLAGSLVKDGVYGVVNRDGCHQFPSFRTE